MLLDFWVSVKTTNVELCKLFKLSIKIKHKDFDKFFQKLNF